MAEPRDACQCQRGRVTALGVGCVTGQDRVTKDKLSRTGRRVCVRVPPHSMAFRGCGMFLSYLDKRC